MLDYRLFFFLLITIPSFGQLASGKYDEGLSIAYNPETNSVTGYFESYTGVSENGNPAFSCIFYIEGILKNEIATVKTYYPADKDDEIIEGTLQLKNNTINIKLPEEHGGCWNVQHFADEPAIFTLSEKTNWIAIQYVDRDKVYFYKSPIDTERKKSYVTKGDILYVDRYNGKWAYCTYYGKKATNGWIKLSELNKL